MPGPPTNPQPRCTMTHDTTHRDDVICPHCGHDHSDSWEIDFGAGIEGSDTALLCVECEKPFMARRIVTITYTTWIRRTEDPKP